MYTSVVRVHKVNRRDCGMAIQKHISLAACNAADFNEVWGDIFRGAETINSTKFNKERLAEELAVVIADNVGGGVSAMFHQNAAEHMAAWEERIRIAKELVLLALEEVF